MQIYMYNLQYNLQHVCCTFAIHQRSKVFEVLTELLTDWNCWGFHMSKIYWHFIFGNTWTVFKGCQLECLFRESDTVNCDDFSRITRELQSSRRVPAGTAVGTWNSFHCGRLVLPRQYLAAIPRASKYLDWKHDSLI